MIYVARAPSLSVVSKLALEVFERRFPVQQKLLFVLMVDFWGGGGYIASFMHKHE